MDKRKKTSKGRSRTQRRKRNDQDVIYTQAKPFNRNRFLLQLATVVAVVLALLFGLRIFFKVKTVEVSSSIQNEENVDVQISGNGKYDAWTIRQASGIQDGENLLTLDKNRVSANIMAELPYVSEVQVRIQLPDTVVIHVTEMEVVYPVQDQEGGWWYLSAEGRIVDTCPAADAEDKTKILGVKLGSPAVGDNAKAYEEPPVTDESGATVPVTVYNQERLETALTVIRALENAGFIGTMDSVDVAKINEIQLWFDGRFQILLGDTSQLAKKLDALSQTLAQMENHNTGILDVRFTKWPDQVRWSQLP